MSRPSPAEPRAALAAGSPPAEISAVASPMKLRTPRGPRAAAALRAPGGVDSAVVSYNLAPSSRAPADRTHRPRG
jgi:hypothetical protein